MAVDIHHKLVRNSLRLKGYNYSEPGAYFITVCTKNRVCYLGNIVDGITISLPISEVVREIWLEIPEKFHFVDLDAFIIMPNHIHGIIIINKEGMDFVQQTSRYNGNNKGLIHPIHVKDCIEDLKVGLINQAPLKNQTAIKNHTPPKAKDWALMRDPRQMVGKIVRYLKAKTARIIHDKFFAGFKWQHNYYEHVVRSVRELKSIREYIINNPLQWALDRENQVSENFNMDLDNYFKDIFDE